MVYDVAVIGAGASGMACAVTAAKRGLTVLVLDKNIQPGKKIRATGNGRCNIANSYFDDTCYRGGQREALSRIVGADSYKRCLDFFDGLGLSVTDKNGYFYPSSMQAASVVNVLARAMEHAGVTCCYGRQVTAVSHRDGRYYISAQVSGEYKKQASRVSKKAKKNQEAAKCLHAIIPDAGGYQSTDGSGAFVYGARNLVLATGGCAGSQYGSTGDGYTFAENLGHHIAEVMPALVPLCSDEGFCSALAGVRVSGQAKLYIDGQRLLDKSGEIQFTDYGISGICVFELSRFAVRALSMGKSVTMSLDFLPGRSFEEAYHLLAQMFGRTSYLSIRDSLWGLLPDKLVWAILERAKVDTAVRAGALDGAKIKALCEQVTGFDMRITGYRDYDMAQVTAGGVTLDEVKPDFESKLSDRLYVVGELLDVDGTCGGYNLTFAFLSGIAAGEGVHK